MLKLLISIFACFCLASTISAAGNDTKGAFLQKHHGVGYNGWVYPYNNYYYSWYNSYPTHFVPAVHGHGCNACHSGCHGTCGLWTNLYACEYTTCAARKCIFYFLNSVKNTTNQL